MGAEYIKNEHGTLPFSTPSVRFVAVANNLQKLVDRAEVETLK